MPVEIREIIIRTDISGADQRRSAATRERELNQLRRELMEECRQIIVKNNRKTGQKR